MNKEFSPKTDKNLKKVTKQLRNTNEVRKSLVKGLNFGKAKGVKKSFKSEGLKF